MTRVLKTVCVNISDDLNEKIINLLLKDEFHTISDVVRFAVLKKLIKERKKLAKILKSGGLQHADLQEKNTT